MNGLKNMKPSLRADLLLAAVSIIWGMGFPVTRMAIDANVGAGLIVAIRFGIAALAIGLLFWKDLRTMTRQEFKAGAVGGIISAVAFLLQVSGQNFTTPSSSAFLSSTNVVIVPILGWLLFKQKPGKKLVMVSIGCFIGAAVLTISPTEGLVLNVGDLLTIACAVVFSLHITYLGTVASKVSAVKLTFAQTFAAAVVATAFTLVFEFDSIAKADFIHGMPAIIYLGLFSTAFAFFAQSYAQKHTAPSKAAIILGTEGLLGSIFSVMLGYEPLTANLVIGGSIIFCSLFAMEINPRSILPKRE